MTPLQWENNINEETESSEIPVASVHAGLAPKKPISVRLVLMEEIRQGPSAKHETSRTLANLSRGDDTACPHACASTSRWVDKHMILSRFLYSNTKESQQPSSVVRTKTLEFRQGRRNY